MSGSIGGDWENSFAHGSRNLRVLDKHIMRGGRTRDIMHPRRRSLFQVPRIIHNTPGMDFQHNDNPFLLRSFNTDPFQVLLEHWSAILPEAEVGSQPTSEQAHHYEDRAIPDPSSMPPSYPYISHLMQVLPEPPHNFWVPQTPYSQQTVSRPITQRWSTRLTLAPRLTFTHTIRWTSGIPPLRASVLNLSP